MIGKFNIFLNCIAGSTIDPLDIVRGEYGDYSKQVNEDIVFLLGLDDLFYLLRENAVIICACVLVFLFITMHFINKSEKIAERKADILHKLLILAVIFSLLTILNIAIKVMESLF